MRETFRTGRDRPVGGTGPGKFRTGATFRSRSRFHVADRPRPQTRAGRPGRVGEGEGTAAPGLRARMASARRCAQVAKAGSAAVIPGQEPAEGADRDRASRRDVAPVPAADAGSAAGADDGGRDPDALPARTVGRAALRILEEEAERELSLRRAQASGPEGALPASGEDASGERQQASGREAAMRRRGGRLPAALLVAFMMAAFAGLLIAIYLRAPAVSHAYPDAEGALRSYLETVNAFLGWLGGVTAR